MSGEENQDVPHKTGPQNAPEEKDSLDDAAMVNIILLLVIGLPLLLACLFYVAYALLLY